MPDRTTHAAPARGWSAEIVLLALVIVAAVSVLIRALLQLEEALSPRLGVIVLIAALGALLAALPLAFASHLFARNWNAKLRAALAALWMCAFFVPAVLFCFALEIRIVEGHIEADSVFELSAQDLFWTLFGAMGMFTPTGLRYVLPWPVIVVALATFLCFYNWPRPTRA